MPREIITVQVGQCGNQIGLRFWEYVCAEHGIGRDGLWQADVDATKEEMEQQLDKVDVFFRPIGRGSKRYCPRSVLVDLDPAVLDNIKASPLGSLFNPDRIVSGKAGTGNNWAKGHYTEGSDIIDDVIDCVRKEVEVCDAVQGFQLCHSLGGGTGSGLGTLILLKLRENYPDRILATYSVYPSPKVSDVVVEPYNATLSIHQLLENSDESFVIDNEALFNLAQNVLKLRKEPTYIELNHVISLVMGGITASLRFPGKLNGDLRKMGVNLVPFPRMHFFMLSQAPLFSREEIGKVKLTVKEITEQMWSGRNNLAQVRNTDGKFLAAAAFYRGQLSTEEVDREVADLQSKYSEDFVEWIPNNLKTTMISTPPRDTPMSGTLVSNTTALKGVFQRISTQFGQLYKRKAFLHWYKGEGMDEMEFPQADSNARDLISEYQDRQDVVIDMERLEAGHAPEEEEEEEEEEE